MAVTITLVGSNGKPVREGTRVRVWYTGGFGKQEGSTDKNGRITFTRNANRTQVSVHNGYRWEDIEDVLPSLDRDMTIRRV